MKILLEISDNKASFFLGVLENFSFVETNNISNDKSQIMDDTIESVNELKLIRQGKLKGIPAKDLLNEI